MTARIAIGAAVLKVVGLNAQKIGTRSESRVPAKATFSGMDYQLTGLGDQRVRISFATVPIVMGGLDCLAILQQIHQRQLVVPYMRLGASYLGALKGLVVVQALDIDEGRIHPFTGVGRVVDGEAEMIILSSQSNTGLSIGTGLATVAQRVFA